MWKCIRQANEQLVGELEVRQRRRVRGGGGGAGLREVLDWGITGGGAAVGTLHVREA